MFTFAADPGNAPSAAEGGPSMPAAAAGPEDAAYYIEGDAAAEEGEGGGAAGADVALEGLGEAEGSGFAPHFANPLATASAALAQPAAAAAMAAAATAPTAGMALYFRRGGARARLRHAAGGEEEGAQQGLERAQQGSERGGSRLRSAQESVAAARAAVHVADALRGMQGARAPMTELQAATALQLRWRQLRANKTRNHWRKIVAFETRNGLKGGAGGAGGAVEDELVGEEGWVRRKNRLTGKVYYLHPGLGLAQWEPPGEALAQQ